jgi:hypothetical protein
MQHMSACLSVCQRGWLFSVRFDHGAIVPNEHHMLKRPIARVTSIQTDLIHHGLPPIIDRIAGRRHCLTIFCSDHLVNLRVEEEQAVRALEDAVVARAAAEA